LLVGNLNQYIPHTMNLSYLQYAEIPEQVFLSSLRDTKSKWLTEKYLEFVDFVIYFLTIFLLFWLLFWRFFKDLWTKFLDYLFGAFMILFITRECVRNLDLRVQVHPGELWVSKQRVHIVLEASKSAGAKGDVPKICGFVHPLHPL
jgi:hypothetical protein